MSPSQSYAGLTCRRSLRRPKAGVLGIKKEKQNVTEIDIRNYAKYILQEGTIIEKRELLSYLKSKLVLENRKLRLEK